MEQTNPSGGVHDHGEKTGVSDVERQLGDGGKVDRTGNLLRREAMVEVRAQASRERYSGKQGKDRLTAYSHTRQGQLRRTS